MRHLLLRWAFQVLCQVNSALILLLSRGTNLDCMWAPPATGRGSLTKSRRADIHQNEPEATREWSPGGQEEMRITVGRRFTAKLAAPAALAMLLTCAPAVRAQDGASAESVADLRSEVQELQKEIHELKGQVTTVQEQQELVPPPPADQKPQTIGETVGSLGKSVDDIRTNLATNLGIQVHGLADVTYDYNLNHPNTSNGSKGGLNSAAPGGCINQLHAFDVNCETYNLAQFNLHIARVSD